MIKAIIFDCFGVLAESSYKRFYETHLSGKPDVIKRIKVLDHAANKGNITHDDFYLGVAELTQMEEPEIREFMKIHPANLELFKYISDVLKPKYKIGFLSNVADNLMDELFTKQQQSVFDDVVLSYEVKLAKPDSAVFELTAARLGVAVDECVFVDDSQVYVDGAEAAGMSSIYYTDFSDFKQKIETKVDIIKNIG